MALRALPNMHSLVPRLSSRHAFRLRLPPSLLAVSASLSQISAMFLPPSLPDTVPSPLSILQELWDGLLRAVPKKKPSYSKSRSRQMAGKGLKDLFAIVKCPSCGRPKRSHYLCPYCVEDARAFMHSLAHDGQAAVAEKLDAVNKQLSDITSKLKPGRRSRGSDAEATNLLESKPSRKALRRQATELHATEDQLKSQFGDRVEAARIRLESIKVKAGEASLSNDESAEVLESSSSSDSSSTEKSA